MPDFSEQPGYLFLVATLLPLLAFLLILLASGVWRILRPYRETPLGSTLYNLFGGDRPGKVPAYVALGAIGLACVLCVTGFVMFHQEQAEFHHEIEEKEKQARTFATIKETEIAGLQA